jgi:protein O-GlcNAc transferase
MPQFTIQQAFALALQHHRSGQIQSAEQLYREVLSLQPDHADALHNLGLIAHQSGRNDIALNLLHQAVRLKSDSADALTNLGNVLRSVARLDEAIAAYSKAVALQPNFLNAHFNLASTFILTGQLDDAIAACRNVLILDPSHVEAHSNLVLFLNYHPGIDPAGVAQEHRQWNLRHARPLARFIQPHPNDRDPHRPLRIGYVSPDFHEHAVSRFALALLANHDRDRFQIFCYAQVLSPDSVTKEYQQCAHTWRNIVGVADAEAAQLIRRDKIDILIDLAGHMTGNRLLVFAQKPAPVQVTYLGYPATTGLETIDYRFTDALADPPGMTEAYCTEQLVRLPQTAWCYQPPQPSPPVAPLPAQQNHHITFGSFNNFTKVNPPLLDLWAQILHRVPDSRLMIKAKALCADSVKRGVQQRMSDHGIAPDRLDLRAWVPAADHLGLYHQIDIALDTYPYHGTTTTCESLWMGVPVITLAGPSHVARVGVSLLTTLGLEHLIATTPEQYIRIATTLATDIPRLKSLRRSLRSRMQQSSLMDAPAFARHIEATYRRMWHTWLQQSLADK